MLFRSVYGRLRHIFDLANALEIVRHEIQNGNGKPFLAIDNPEGQPRLPITPIELDSVAATHRMPDQSMSAIISGGVSIQTSVLSKRLVVDKSQTNRVALESSNDTNKFANAKSLDSSGLKENSDESLRPRRDVRFWK